MLRNAKPHIRALRPYEPGPPIEALVREHGVRDPLKLASNENPLGPSPKAVEALCGAAGQVHRYPDGACRALRAALSRRLQVAPEQLVFGAGSDEILELVAKTFLAPGDELLCAWPSFAMYPIVAQGMGADCVRVPLNAELGHDVEAMAAALSGRTRVAVICNPNNPTGTSLGEGDLQRFVEALPEDVVLLLDEAYAEFARRPDFPDSLALLARRPATAVLRTFSKIYGLAGLRVGYAVCGPELAGLLERARHPFNVNALAETAALAALADTAHFERSRRMNAEGMALLRRELAALAIRSWPSDANFLLAELGGGACEALLKLGVSVRDMQGFGLPGCARITIGTPEQNERLLKALHALRGAQA